MWLFRFILIGVAVFASTAIASAEEFARGTRRDLLKLETTALPKGKTVIEGGERFTPPGGRSPWHTAVGPKLLYVIEGTLTVEGLAGRVFATCGPAPKLCFSHPGDIFFFRNPGQIPVKWVVIGMDPKESPTNHEEVGQVVAISSNQVTVAVGDPQTSTLAVPRREITITVNEAVSVAVGDDVVTMRFNETRHTAESLVKLSRQWQ